MARDPTAKLLSQFFYARSTLGGAYGDWHRCVTFGEYVESRRARHNHQYGQMVTGNRKGACGNDAEKPLARPQHRATIAMLCAGVLVVVLGIMTLALAQHRRALGDRGTDEAESSSALGGAARRLLAQSSFQSFRCERQAPQHNRRR